MINKFTPSPSLTVPQVFFAQRMLEALSRRTIDSYRARLHNPNTILQELYQVLIDFKKNKIKSYELTIVPLITEAIEMLHGGKHYLEPAVESKLLLKLLQEGLQRKQEDKERRGETLLMHALKLQITKGSGRYGQRIFSLIKNEIETLSAKDAWDAKDFDTLSTLTDYWLSELLYKGYSKSYLFTLASKLFKGDTEETPESSFEFLGHVTTREKESYRVVFDVLLYEKIFNRIRGRKQFLTPYLLPVEEREEISSLSESASIFLKERTNYFIKIDCKGLDYISVVHKARLKLDGVLDSIHLGFPEYNVVPLDLVLVSGEKAPQNTQMQKATYNIDGHYKNNQQMFDLWNQRLAAIRENDSIARETKNKITSAVRYLRLGWGAPGLEQKFLHYWIGMEYLFSNYEVGDSTIRRIRKYFLLCEVTSYIKRNVSNFHGDIQRLDLADSIPGYSDNLTYLHDPGTYAYIRDNYVTTQPLLAFRAARYYERITDPKKLRESGVKRHQQNLDWHLARIYRLRNEIVHDAALHMNIETVTGNLRYYLTFILNLLLDYLNNYPEDIDEDGQITIDDCLSYYEILYKSIESENFDFKALMRVPDIVGLFY